MSSTAKSTKPATRARSNSPITARQPPSPGASITLTKDELDNLLKKEQTKHAVQISALQLQLDAAKAQLQQATKPPATAATTDNSSSIPAMFQTPRHKRQQDEAYTATKAKAAALSPPPPATQSSPAFSVEDLAKAISNISSTKDGKDSSTKDPPKFSGQDADYEQWHKLFRSFLQAKG